MSLTVETGTDSSGHTTFGVRNSVTRLRFFLGQLLTQRDLQAEQRFHLVLQRLVQREAFGTGTVAGLGVASRTGLPPLSVVVSPGLAMDPGGRELLLEKEVVIDVGSPPLAPGSPFSPAPTTRAGLASASVARFKFPSGSFTATDLSRFARKLESFGIITDADVTALNSDSDIPHHPVTLLLQLIPEQPSTPVLPASPLPDPPDTDLPPTVQWLLAELIGETFIGLRYRELGVDPSPALQDSSCCGSQVCVPARTQEGVFIVLASTPFPDTDNPFTEFVECLSDPGGFAGPADCHRAMCECLKGAWRGSPGVGDPCVAEDLPVVAIARVLWNRFEQTDGQILAVDDCSWVALNGTAQLRPLAPGNAMVHALLEVLTGCQGVVT